MSRIDRFARAHPPDAGLPGQRELGGGTARPAGTFARAANETEARVRFCEKAAQPAHTGRDPGRQESGGAIPPLSAAKKDTAQAVSFFFALCAAWPLPDFRGRLPAAGEGGDARGAMGLQGRCASVGGGGAESVRGGRHSNGLYDAPQALGRLRKRLKEPRPSAETCAAEIQLYLKE